MCSHSCDVMVKMLTDGQWICYCFWSTKFSFGKSTAARQAFKASGWQWTTLQLLHHLFGCILLWISTVVEVWVFQKSEKRPKDCRNGCICTSRPMVTRAAFLLLGGSFLLCKTGPGDLKSWLGCSPIPVFWARDLYWAHDKVYNHVSGITGWAAAM